ncbi:MAG: gsiC 2 [Marmoricola sp.]|nr:gsiC 2 [Marmoricola sp.]
MTQVRFVGQRFAAMVIIVLALAAAVFALQKMSPLDPVHARLGGQASQGAIAAERHALGLDKPIVTQFGHYLAGLVHGDLGDSYRTRRPVTTDLLAYVPATAELAASGLIIALVLAIAFAFASTLRVPGAALFRLGLMLGASVPTFLLGVFGILLFYQHFGWLPASGRTSIGNAPTGPTHLLTLDGLLHGRPDVTWDAIKHLLMPATAIALGPAVAIGRVLRSSLEGELGSDYVRTARAKGRSERQILLGHVVRNAIGAAVSMTGLQVGLMFAGVLVVEQVFGWPGLGLYIAESIPVADFPAIAGVTLLLGSAYVVINAAVDVIQAAADPRIRV